MQRFWNKVQKTSGAGCWLWTGATFANGYGKFVLGGKFCKAHRIAASLSGQEIEGCVVRHVCDNPLCVRPSHLVAGTQRENQLDKVAKGRQARGSVHGRAKLNERSVATIRRRYASGQSQVALARAFGVSQPLISQIVRRKIWEGGCDNRPL